MMKLFVALALSAVMPSAHAMGTIKVCDDSATCMTQEGSTLVPTDTCQSVREEATTPAGAHVALYPGWVTQSEPSPGFLAVPSPDPLACWDACVDANPLATIVQVVTLDGNFIGCYCGEFIDTILPIAIFVTDTESTTVVSCDATGPIAPPPGLPGPPSGGARKLETINRSGRTNWWEKQ